MLQDDHRAFRRQLEDKRPVVESNLLSGRQYIASEPPLSDTSDTECEFAFALILRNFLPELIVIRGAFSKVFQCKYIVMEAISSTTDFQRKLIS